MGIDRIGPGEIPKLIEPVKKIEAPSLVNNNKKPRPEWQPSEIKEQNNKENKPKTGLGNNIDIKI